MRYAHPGTPGALVALKSAYGNFIDGKFVEPIGGEFFMNTSPVDGSNIGQFPRSDAKDIDFALGCGAPGCRRLGKTSAQHRANLLLQVADRIEANLEYLAVAESWDNGKPIRETLNADLPLAVDHFRYSPAAFARRREARRRLMKRRWLTISMSLRRGRANYSVEFPAADGRLEAGSGAGGGQLRGT